jgi:hypothetical protein
LDAFDGFFVHWDEIVDVCKANLPESHDGCWSESPMELVLDIINDRDDLRSQFAAASADQRKAEAEVERLRFAVEYASQMATETEHIRKYLVDALLAAPAIEQPAAAACANIRSAVGLPV